MTVATSTPGRAPVGALLRNWRKERRFSQLELALRADSSARHISFIETGRARPSRDMLLRLADHLDIPIRERNTLLTAAGYAAAYPETPLDDRAMRGLHATLDLILRAHEPHPALVMDGHYDIVAANRGVLHLLGDLPPELARQPPNALRLTLHPRGMAPRIRNLAEWRAHLLQRVERQTALRDSGPLRALYDEVAGYPAPVTNPGAHDDEGPQAHPYALPLRIDVQGRTLSLISTATTFNTPMDVTVSELAIETFLPADARTAQALRAAFTDLGPG
ncbi:helix-turn-helix domain-containing protein [Streptomyces tsukubensis]|uniref:Transcriptional regulator n=1 Tax=Streptomyces tsukubensis TaxID=83656 RepID=A0A1V4A989_9ACTN|nr:helix-turn-helix transcriptional regulator [Streptomyces tsukubensis]OON80056.1 transcriptional regulator [Streptomyces tsukubensis]QFR97288.1 helix-turn-helix domain-containing protein [Streptomyces tsukubensis]